MNLLLVLLLTSFISSIPVNSNDPVPWLNTLSNPNQECPICLCEKTNMVFAFNCIHEVCRRCARDWISAKKDLSNCPLCRASVLSNDDLLSIYIDIARNGPVRPEIREHIRKVDRSRRDVIFAAIFDVEVELWLSRLPVFSDLNVMEEILLDGTSDYLVAHCALKAIQVEWEELAAILLRHVPESGVDYVFNGLIYSSKNHLEVFKRLYPKEIPQYVKESGVKKVVEARSIKHLHLLIQAFPEDSLILLSIQKSLANRNLDLVLSLIVPITLGNKSESLDSSITQIFHENLIALHESTVKKNTAEYGHFIAEKMTQGLGIGTIVSQMAYSFSHCDGSPDCLSESQEPSNYSEKLLESFKGLLKRRDAYVKAMSVAFFYAVTLNDSHVLDHLLTLDAPSSQICETLLVFLSMKKREYSVENVARECSLSSWDFVFLARSFLGLPATPLTDWTRVSREAMMVASTLSINANSTCLPFPIQAHPRSMSPSDFDILLLLALKKRNYPVIADVIKLASKNGVQKARNYAKSLGFSLGSISIPTWRRIISGIARFAKL